MSINQSQASKDGAIAYEKSRWLDQNPYPHRSIESREWIEGWMEARAKKAGSRFPPYPSEVGGETMIVCGDGHSVIRFWREVDGRMFKCPACVMLDELEYAGGRIRRLEDKLRGMIAEKAETLSEDEVIADITRPSRTIRGDDPIR